MPELPEVETTKEGIKSHLEGQTISQIIVRNHSLRLPVGWNISELCAQQKIEHVTRRAKYIILQLTKGNLLIHLGMSGHLQIVPNNTTHGKHDHIDLVLNNGQTLRYCDPRRFGLFHYFEEPLQNLRLLSKLGPEPLTEEFNSYYLYEKIRHRNQPIKSLIMTNEIVVGVGNIYATESLFYAQIHPQKKANTINYAQCIRLTYYIKEVLQKAIHAGGTTLKDFYTSDGKPGYFSISLNVYGRSKEPCIQCKTPIEAVFIAGRNSAFCPYCQPLNNE
jgi:formamidopyrimidine-DNA glycosylase